MTCEPTKPKEGKMRSPTREERIDRSASSDQPTCNKELLTRLQIANSAMQAARLAFDVAELSEVRGIVDGLLDDVREMIDQLLGGLYHAHDFGPWEDDPAGVVRYCECGAVDWRPEG